jgi:hypothetical protein
LAVFGGVQNKDRFIVFVKQILVGDGGKDHEALAVVREAKKKLDAVSFKQLLPTSKDISICKINYLPTIYDAINFCEKFSAFRKDYE